MQMLEYTNRDFSYGKRMAEQKDLGQCNLILETPPLIPNKKTLDQVHHHQHRKEQSTYWQISTWIQCMNLCPLHLHDKTACEEIITQPWGYPKYQTNMHSLKDRDLSTHALIKYPSKMYLWYWTNYKIPTGSVMSRRKSLTKRVLRTKWKSDVGHLDQTGSLEPRLVHSMWDCGLKSWAWKAGASCWECLFPSSGWFWVWFYIIAKSIPMYVFASP